MSVSSSDFLDLARRNLISSPREIECRNTISLAYYASYHAIKPHLSKNAPNTHSALIDYLCDENMHQDEKMKSSDLRALGLLLETMKKNRVYADYFLKKNIKERDARKSIISAEAFKAVLEELVEGRDDRSVDDQ
ncbi:hypothetical protein B9T19_10300 [Ignatzschineria sp. F8392]|nr:hypothetical protein B9T19_10300 [Ignatzschineria sp. F8392]